MSMIQWDQLVVMWKNLNTRHSSSYFEESEFPKSEARWRRKDNISSLGYKNPHSLSIVPNTQNFSNQKCKGKELTRKHDPASVIPESFFFTHIIIHHVWQCGLRLGWVGTPGEVGPLGPLGPLSQAQVSRASPPIETLDRASWLEGSCAKSEQTYLHSSQYD